MAAWYGECTREVGQPFSSPPPPPSPPLLPSSPHPLLEIIDHRSGGQRGVREERIAGWNPQEPSCTLDTESYYPRRSLRKLDCTCMIEWIIRRRSSIDIRFPVTETKGFSNKLTELNCGGRVVEGRRTSGLTTRRSPFDGKRTALDYLFSRRGF